MGVQAADHNSHRLVWQPRHHWHTFQVSEIRTGAGLNADLNLLPIYIAGGGLPARGAGGLPGRLVGVIPPQGEDSHVCGLTTILDGFGGVGAGSIQVVAEEQIQQGAVAQGRCIRQKNIIKIAAGERCANLTGGERDIVVGPLAVIDNHQDNIGSASTVLETNPVIKIYIEWSTGR